MAREEKELMVFILSFLFKDLKRTISLACTLRMPMLRVQSLSTLQVERLSSAISLLVETLKSTSSFTDQPSKSFNPIRI